MMVWTQAGELISSQYPTIPESQDPKDLKDLKRSQDPKI